MPPERALAWSRITLGLVIVVVLALVTSVVVGLYRSGRAPTPIVETPAPTPTLTVKVIRSAQVFDPVEDGGSGWENDEQVPYAFDNDPKTAWQTEEYDKPTIPDKKPGVGLVFDLGHPEAISQASLMIDLLPITVALYVPSGDPATVEEPDMTTIADWTPIVYSSLTQPVTTLNFSTVQTRYVVVYISRLVDIGDGITQADLAEVSFSG